MSEETTFLERLVLEEEELGKKIVGLNKGLLSDGFADKVGAYQFKLLHLQRTTMIAYRQVLEMRIKDLTMSDENVTPKPIDEERLLYFEDPANNPVLEFKVNGDILLKGRLAGNDKEVIDALRECFNLKVYGAEPEGDQ